MLVWTLLALASAATPDRERFVVFPERAIGPSPALYQGEFSGPPVAQWDVRLPGGRMNTANHTERARPVIVGEHILVGSAAGDALYMLSRRDGSVVRAFSASNSVESGAVVVNDRVYFADVAGIVWCYQLDGTLVWQRESDAPILVSPTVHEGRLFVTTVDDLAITLDIATGQLLWQYQRRPDAAREAELALYAAPPAVIVGDSVLLGFSDGALVGIEQVSGDVQWDRRIGEGRYPDIVAAPVVVGADVYASGYFEPLVAMDLATRNVRWRLDIGAANAPAVGDAEGTAILYHPGTDGKLRAIVALTGAELWTWNSGETGALTTPIVTPAGLLLASSEGGIWLLDAATGDTTWTYAGSTQLAGISSAPAIDGRQLLVVTNAGRLHSMIVPESEPTEARVGLWTRRDR